MSENTAREAVIAFWTRQLAQPTHDNGVAFHNALMAMATPKITPEQVERFAVALRDVLNRPGYVGTCVTDYGPDDRLEDALKAADIDPFLALPVKTITREREGRASAVLGYGGGWRWLNEDGTLGDPVNV